MTDGPGAPARESAPSLVRTLCEETMDATTGDGLDGVAVSRCARSWYAGVAYASDDRAVSLEALQETLGEGPGPRALESRGPVLVDDLATHPLAHGWLAFTQEALLAGVRAVFAFPVQIGAADLGLLTLHGSAPVEVDEVALTEYVKLADAVGVALLAPSPPGTGGDGVLLDDLLDSAHAVTHQAVGMVSVQLGTSLEGAMAVLRGRAFSDGATLAETARQVVARTVAFGDGGGQDPAGESRPGAGEG